MSKSSSGGQNSGMDHVANELSNAGNQAIDEAGKFGSEAIDSVTDIFNGGSSKSSDNSSSKK